MQVSTLGIMPPWIVPSAISFLTWLDGQFADEVALLVEDAGNVGQEQQARRARARRRSRRRRCRR